MSAAFRATAIDAMLVDIALAVARSNPSNRAAEVAAALRGYVADRDLLCEYFCPCSDDGYTRHMLAEDRCGRYAVAALVWRPGQMSRVHAHRTWCALGVHQGTLTETIYGLSAEGESPAPLACRLCRPGDLSHGPADPGTIHRIANLGCEDAVSIHVYGVPFRRFPTDVNTILAA